MLSTVIGRLRLIGLLEGASFLLLLGIAMPMKYMLGIPEAVRIVGMAHGVLFIAFIALTIQAKFVYNWRFSKMFLLWVASVLPFGTFYADYKLLKPRVDSNPA
jgi:integral membrane protein